MAELVDLKDSCRKAGKAFLVGLRREGESAEYAAGLLAELAELVGNIGFEVAGSELVGLREPNPRYLVGAGKFAEIKSAAKRLGCECIVFDDAISPAQQRNWERDSRRCVIDRQEVILEIFARRAVTREARLQVELARLEYSLPRLRRAWTHLSRQRGGGVTQRGAGESQLETDRRRVMARISRLKREISEVGRVRATQRKRRERSEVFTAAIVGYTNAGKSSLLNAVAGADVAAEDRLFATLDPTTRELRLPGGAQVLITDTVGFVRRLPHSFVEAFKSTLEEAAFADMLIHVVDASNPDALLHMETTKSVLAELGAGDKPSIVLLNKSDAVTDEIAFRHLVSCCPNSIVSSVRTGEGMAELAARMESAAAEKSKVMEIFVPHEQFGLVSRLQEAGAVRRRVYAERGVFLAACVPERLSGMVEALSRAMSEEERREVWASAAV